MYLTIHVFHQHNTFLPLLKRLEKIRKVLELPLQFFFLHYNWHSKLGHFWVRGHKRLRGRTFAFEESPNYIYQRFYLKIGMDLSKPFLGTEKGTGQKMVQSLQGPLLKLEEENVQDIGTKNTQV